MLIDERGLADHVLGMKSTGKAGPKRDAIRAVHDVSTGNGLSLHCAQHTLALSDGWPADMPRKFTLQGCSAASILVVHK